MLSHSLDSFIDWKNYLGLLVDIFYILYIYKKENVNEIN